MQENDRIMTLYCGADKAHFGVFNLCTVSAKSVKNTFDYMDSVGEAQQRANRPAAVAGMYDSIAPACALTSVRSVNPLHETSPAVFPMHHIIPKPLPNVLYLILHSLHDTKSYIKAMAIPSRLID